jgi:asparagine synthase (glutamine-hydrolysing)
MCGIAGIFAYADTAEAPRRAELLAIRDHMRARGPDGEGEWWDADRRVAFGHRRLSIIDLSDRASQPMQSEDALSVITFNGEIYNFAALKAELEAKGRRFRTTSDTEVLLHLWETEGPAMVARLRGMFALAIWDQRRKGLFLARDPYGIKPLYYADDGKTFRFASQVKALLAGGGVSRDPDSAGLVGFHLFGHVPDPFTMYRAITAVPAGATLWVEKSGAEAPKVYANLAAELAYAPKPDGRDFQEQVRSAVLDSVRAHLVADVEVGAFLSAGIDSGALVGLMKDAGQAKVRTLTLTYDEFRGAPDDEAPLAERLARVYGTQHSTRAVDRKEFLADLPLILEAMDQPSIDGVNTWFVSKACHELGLKVALSGVGGDELFGGYSTFREVPQWRALLGPFAAIPGLGVLSRSLIRAVAPGLARSNPKVLGVLEYPRTWAGAYFLKRALLLPFELGDVLDPALAAEGCKRLDPFGLLQNTITPDPGNPVGRVIALESGAYMRSQLLRDTDWAGMAHSLEVRTPLVDFTLLKTLAPVLGDIRGQSGKVALAQAPSTPLPQDVIHRTKTGFGIPLAAWLTGQPSSNDHLTSRSWARQILEERAASAVQVAQSG